MYTGGVTANADGTFTAAIFSNSGGTRTLLTSAPSTTGTGQLTLEVVGHSLQLLFNDTLVLSVFDTHISTLGAVGIRGSNNVTFGNFFISG
jgi:hypothetical protein